MKLGMEYIAFAKEAIKNFFNTGNLIPSSQFLSTKICEQVRRYSPVATPLIIEVGAGTGKITQQLLRYFNESKFFVFEPNSSFYEILQKRVSQYYRNGKVELINDCVERFAEENNLKSDVIVSSLPLLSFKKPVREKVLTALEKLMHDSTILVQYGYTPLTGKFLNKRFEIINKSFVPFNIPPAIIYVCKKRNFETQR